MRVAICVVASYRVACMSSSGFATSGVGVGGWECTHVVYTNSVHGMYTQYNTHFTHNIASYSRKLEDEFPLTEGSKSH